jgi:hypothetical protein
MGESEMKQATWTMPAPKGFVWTDAGAQCLVGQPIPGMLAIIVAARPIQYGTAVEITAEMPELPRFLAGGGDPRATVSFESAVGPGALRRDPTQSVFGGGRRKVALVFSVAASSDDEAYQIGEQLVGQIVETIGDCVLDEIDVDYGGPV